MISDGSETQACCMGSMIGYQLMGYRPIGGQRPWVHILDISPWRSMPARDGGRS